MSFNRIAIFVSGKGTNAKNIACHFSSSKNNTVYCIISSKPNIELSSFSTNMDIHFCLINNCANSYKDLLTYLKENNITLLVLAGFIKKVPEVLINAFKKKIINIHPALLPKYGGKGFYGMVVHKAVIKAKDKISGATIHFVNNEYDKGHILMQKDVVIADYDNAFTVSKKVLKIEHEIFPKAVKYFCLNKIIVNNNKVSIYE